MNKLKKTVSLTMCAIMLLTSGVIGASAAETSTADEQAISVAAAASEPGIEPQADVIYWKYRYYNGHYQKRRWNETKHLWVDLMWINCDDEFV